MGQVCVGSPQHPSCSEGAVGRNDDLRPRTRIMCDVVDCQKAKKRLNFRSSVQVYEIVNLARSTFAMVGNTGKRAGVRC